MESQNALRTSLGRIGRFGGHFLEMCLAMCAGAIALNVLIWGGAALMGYPDLIQRFPEPTAAVITLTLSLPMAAWMRFRGMEWRPTLEMSGATILVGALLIGAAVLGFVPKASLVEWQIRLACPVMLAAMLVRFDLYAGHAGHIAPMGNQTVHTA